MEDPSLILLMVDSVIATASLKLADYVVTEAGFGADLGAEKFLDIRVENEFENLKFFEMVKQSITWDAHWMI